MLQCKPCSVQLYRLQMDFPVQKDSARPSNNDQQGNAEEENEDTHLDIKIESQDIAIDNIKVERWDSGFNIVNVFVDESETLQTSEEQAILSNDDPLAAPTIVSKREEKTEKKINGFFKSCISIRSTQPSLCLTVLEPCPRSCYLKLTPNDMKHNFDSYWHNSTFSSRYEFIYEMTEIIPTRHRFINRINCKYQKYQSIFYLSSKNGRVIVCKLCFLRTICEQDCLIDAILDSRLAKMNELTRHPHHLPWSPLPPCEDHCHLKLTEYDQRHNFFAYHGAKTFEEKASFIQNKITITLPSENLDPTVAFNPKDVYFTTFALNSKKGPQTVCHQCFRTVIDEKEAFIQSVLHSKWLASVGKSGVDKSVVYKSAVDKSAVDKSAVDKSDVDKSAVDKLSVDKLSVDKSTVDKSAVDKSAVNKLSVDKSAVGKSAVGKSAVHKLTLAKLADRVSTNNLNKKTTVKLPDTNWENTVQVQKHIKKFPICEGYHYPGHSSGSYLPMGLTLETMYKLYKSAVYKPVGFSLYHLIFRRTNLKFRPVFLGQCKECESSITKLKSANLEKRRKTQKLLGLHIAEVEGANDSKYRDESAADSSNGVLMVCYFGYQQSLPTPCLKEPLAFYKRPLWTYNFVIQQHSGQKTPEGNTRFYMWDESKGGKTANEMASCLYSYLQSLDSNVRSVIFCSSAACELSRSKTVSLMFTYFMLSEQKLVTVEHKFLPEGHFQIEGQKFYNCEKYRGKIEEPQDWYQAFRQPVESGEKAQVITMTEQRFYNFEFLWKNYAPLSEPLIDQTVTRLLYTRNGVVCYANGWSTHDEFALYTFSGQLKHSNLKRRRLENLVNAPITETKKQDLLGLVSLLSSSKAKSFYLDLCRVKNPGEKTVVVNERVDLNKENQRDDNEEDSEPPQKMHKKISCETNFDEFPLDIKDESIE
ncbi:uncharacterized protein LOC117180204 [Belonocnema kinseyi]|uniref:uncharacterized protein LOC117180204 n=1 Tax=Belonocnema kinseyi TaxID=2817044 RepID=UPI00143DE0D2|nr:uncharacterized protein LOC117180204 [Belonocnema kinseyi]